MTLIVTPAQTHLMTEYRALRDAFGDHARYCASCLREPSCAQGEALTQRARYNRLLARYLDVQERHRHAGMTDVA